MFFIKQILQINMIKYFRQTNKHNWQLILDDLQRKIMSIGKGDYQLELKKLKVKPSDNQRGYYYAVILPAINNHLTNQGDHYSSLEQLHLDIKAVVIEKFGLYDEVVNKLTGKTEKRPISISDEKGDRENVAKFISYVLQFASEFWGLYIPEPYYNKHNNLT